jgi:hypothetical protein
MHFPLLHVGVLPLQTAHVPPGTPHALLAVPGWHV